MSRILPDNNDIVVWKLDEAAAPFVNSSTSTNSLGSTANLTALSGRVLVQQPSLFAATGTGSCITLPGDDGDPRNYVQGAAGAEPQPPVTFSCWMYMRTYTPTGYTQHLFTKRDTDGVWSGGIYGALGFQVDASSSGELQFYIGQGAGFIIVPPAITMPLFTWNHVGMTYDGYNIVAFINGNFVGSVEFSGSISYGGNGQWFFGAIPDASGNAEDSAISVCDFRIANVARPLSYFQNIYRSGQLTFGSTVTTYYKLRSYDTGCVPPTAVYWTSTSPDFSEAPALMCGGPYSPLEVVDSWEVLG